MHPVPMRTTFSVCVLVNYAIAPDALRRWLPSHLAPDLHAAIACREDGGELAFTRQPSDGARADIDARYAVPDGPDRLPASSRFPDLRAAQAFLSELYVAFGARRRRDGRVEVVRIERTPWQSRVVDDRVARYDAMTSGVLFGPGEAEIDSIFLVRDLRYRWERLRLEHPAA